MTPDTAAATRRPARPSAPAEPGPGSRRRMSAPAPSVTASRAGDLTAATAGLGLGVLVAAWWLTVASSWWSTPSTAAVALSELTGLVGVGLLLGSVLLTARVPWLERAAGLDVLIRWHRRIAPYGAYLVTAHVLLAIVGYAGVEGRGVLPETWSLAWTWRDMLAAYAGFAMLVAAGLTSWRVARRRMRYETWWAVHLYTYLGIGLSLLHQLSTGVTFVGHTAMRWTWLAAHVAILATVLWYRLLTPLVRSLWHGMRVERVVRQGRGTISVILRGRRLDRLPMAGGQFAHFRFCRRGLWWQAHPYSISGLPWQGRLRITMAVEGDYAKAIMRLAPGTRVLFEGPYGAFTAHRRSPGRRVLLVGGGVGITPIRTVLDDLPPQSRPIVVYRVRKGEDAILVEELQRLVDERGGQLHVWAGRRRDQPVDARRLMRLAPDLPGRHVYVCGPVSLVNSVRSACTLVGVPAERFHAEEFAW